MGRRRHAQARDPHHVISQAQQRGPGADDRIRRRPHAGESNAIIRYLARGSDLIPQDAFAAAKMDEWLFWEQYSHEPYVAVCRFQMVYLGKASSDLDPDKIKRGYAALARMEHQLAATRFLVGDSLSLADISLLAYTRLAHEGGFHLDGYAAVRRWIGESEIGLGLVPLFRSS
jgi:glutathione S-transferase